MGKRSDKIRVTTQCGNKTITVEMTEKQAKNSVVTAYGCAIRAIQEANRRYEKDGDHFEYLNAVHFAMSQCSMAVYNSLRKAAIYY